MKFTIIGPRLQDLDGFESPVNVDIKEVISDVLIAHKHDTLITSATFGIEMWAATFAEANGVAYEMVVPCANYDGKWPWATKTQYQKLLKNATKVHTLSQEAWHYRLILAKDEFMCNNSEKVYHFYGTTPKYWDPAKYLCLISRIENDFFINL